MCFYEWNEWKNVQRDLDSPILTKYFVTVCKKMRPLGRNFRNWWKIFVCTLLSNQIARNFFFHLHNLVFFKHSKSIRALLRITFAIFCLCFLEDFNDRFFQIPKFLFYFKFTQSQLGKTAQDILFNKEYSSALYK